MTRVSADTGNCLGAGASTLGKSHVVLVMMVVSRELLVWVLPSTVMTAGPLSHPSNVVPWSGGLICLVQERRKTANNSHFEDCPLVKLRDTNDSEGKF